MELIRFRGEAVTKIPRKHGVYILCALDEVPIYVGHSEAKGGIRERVGRHLTSARSDVIANRQLDVWEVAYVWYWIIEGTIKRMDLEAHLFHLYHTISPLLNGNVPKPPHQPQWFPDPDRVQVLTGGEIESRRQVQFRLPRQAKHFSDLLDHFLNVKDSVELRLALEAHFERLERAFKVLSRTLHPSSVKSRKWSRSSRWGPPAWPPLDFEYPSIPP